VRVSHLSDVLVWSGFMVLGYVFGHPGWDGALWVVAGLLVAAGILVRESAA
jgi:hypothetical protein